MSWIVLQALRASSSQTIIQVVANGNTSSCIDGAWQATAIKTQVVVHAIFLAGAAPWIIATLKYSSPAAMACSAWPAANKEGVEKTQALKMKPNATPVATRVPSVVWPTSSTSS